MKKMALIFKDQILDARIVIARTLNVLNFTVNALQQECIADPALVKAAKTQKKMTLNDKKSLIKFWKEIQKHFFLEKLASKK